MCLEYVNQLTDEQLKEIYKLYLNDGEKILALDIYREDYKITLRGKIEISFLTDLPDEKIIIYNDYCLEVNIYHHRHCEKNTSIFRKYMFETFGMSYALDFLFNDNLVMSEEEE